MSLRVRPGGGAGDDDDTQRRARVDAEPRAVEAVLREIAGRFHDTSVVAAREAAPPMWKVRIVSWVPGSPIDWAAMMPTASPMLTWVPRARSRP